MYVRLHPVHYGCFFKNWTSKACLIDFFRSPWLAWLALGSPLPCCCWLLAAGCWLLAAGCWLLAAGCWLLAAGCWLLAAGCWLLAAGCWLLAAGCWLLAAGCWLLAAGCWLLAAGCWLLAAGCWLLAAGCWPYLPHAARRVSPVSIGHDCFRRRVRRQRRRCRAQLHCSAIVRTPLYNA